MPVSDYVNYPLMRSLEVDTMLWSGQRLDYTVTYDAFGAEVITYTAAETFKCGIRTLLISEQPSFTGTALNFDARIRMPYSAWLNFNSRDRIRVTIGTSIVDYEIIGSIVPTPFTTIVEVARVQ